MPMLPPANDRSPRHSNVASRTYEHHFNRSGTMSLTKLPPVASLPGLSATTRTDVLDLLFEPSTALHTLSLPLIAPGSATARSYANYDDLVAAVGCQLTDLAESASASDTDWLQSILGSHPRLGEKKAALSALSEREQAAMEQASGPGDQKQRDEAETLRRLNGEYEAAFPGLRYVVFVDGRPRSVIFEDMRRRIARADIMAEQKEAIKAMCDIAADRARKLQ